MLNIKKYRTQRNMTQQQLADALHVTQGAVYQWESGQTKPTIAKLQQMAQMFDCTVDDLIGE